MILSGRLSGAELVHHCQYDVGAEGYVLKAEAGFCGWTGTCGSVIWVPVGKPQGAGPPSCFGANCGPRGLFGWSVRSGAGLAEASMFSGWLTRRKTGAAGVQAERPFVSHSSRHVAMLMAKHPGGGRWGLGAGSAGGLGEAPCAEGHHHTVLSLENPLSFDQVQMLMVSCPDVRTVLLQGL